MKKVGKRIDVHQQDHSQAAERIACYTSFTFSYLAKARLLAWSLKRFHPSWDFIAVITDEPPEGVQFSAEDEPFDDILWGQDLPIADNMSGWLFKHNVVEICTAVKGPVLHLLVQSGYDKIIYLDPDIAVMNSLERILELLNTHSVILTPHQLVPETNDAAIRDNEISSLKHGIFNLGFLAIRGTGEGARFAKWWSERLKSYCYDDPVNGLFTDQRWCDHVPVFFDDVCILKDPGYNVASWNISNRVIEIDEDGHMLVNGVQLCFFHVTKYGPVGEAMTARYALDNTPVYEIWAWYRRKLEQFLLVGLPDKWWFFGKFDNGMSISKECRHLYKNRQDLSDKFPNPFHSGEHSFYEWFKVNDDCQT